jgi:ubiquinone/menaquinone biosynthesis C-methylase UbiE
MDIAGESFDNTSSSPARSIEPEGRGEDASRVWERIASDYYRLFPPNETVFSYGPLVASEAELKLLGPVAGKKVLDLGCGAGSNAVALAKAGARVIAVDFSESRLQIARKVAERAEVRVEFRRSELSELVFLPARTIDICVCIGSLNLVRDWGRLVRAVERVLDQKGIFVGAIEHPFWSVISRANGSVARAYSDPISFEAELIPGRDDSRVAFNSITVSGLLGLLQKEGFRVTSLVELEATAPPTDPYYRLYPPTLAKAIPPVLVFKAQPHG